MELLVGPRGLIRAIYSEEIALGSLGSLAIRRASHVEPDGSGAWHADLQPVQGPVLGPYPTRSEALAAEVAWIEAHWLTPAN